MNVMFAQGEYVLLPDGCVSVPLGTVRSKLPKTVTIDEPQHSQIDALRAALQAQGVNADVLETWLALNIKQTRENRRSVRKLVTILKELDALRQQYGADVLQQAILKVNGYDEPGKCTLPYLRAVLSDVAQKTAAPVVAASPVDAPQTPEAIWQRVHAELERRINRASFNTWLRRVQFLGVQQHALRLGVETENGQLGVSAYGEVIRQLWNAQGGPQIALIAYQVSPP